MKNFSGVFRSIVNILVSGSLILSPVVPAYARSTPDARDNADSVIPGMNAQARPDARDNVDSPRPTLPESKKVTMPQLPPGVPVPVPVPAPTPRPPVVVEKHREHQSPRVDRDYGPNRYDKPDYYRNRTDWRQDRHREWAYRPHGSVYRSIPAEAFALGLVGGMFFYHMGTYYRHTHEGYVVVQAPLGARIRVLPDRCSVMYIEGRRYYVCDDVYYEPDGDEYVVIERPSRIDYQIEVGDEVRIKAEFLNVRSGPGKRYKVVSQLYRGEIVEIGGMESEWYYVRLQNGLYGWILQEHVSLYRSRHEIKG